MDSSLAYGGEKMERQRDPETIELLKKLKSRLLSRDISTARLAAFKLAHLQEDGMDILKEVLFGKTSRSSKKAAAYGIRSTKGRMKKVSLEVLEEGLKQENSDTRNVCIRCLQIMVDKNSPSKPSKPRGPKRKIHEVQGPKKHSRFAGSNNHTRKNTRDH